MLFLEIVLFGLCGVVMWSIHLILVLVVSTGILAGLTHSQGYRNFSTNDNSYNLMHWGILFSGEELHNNHHQDPAAAKLSVMHNEFDLGWLYIKLLVKVNLATLRKDVADIEQPVVVDSYDNTLSLDQNLNLYADSIPSEIN